MFEGDVLNLAGPPRDVPLLVRLNVLFGGFVNQFGWLFVGFGLIFVWAFTLSADLTSWYHFRGELETAVGRAVHSEPSRYTGSGYNEDTPVYANHYYFMAPDGVKYEGISYSAGWRCESGEKVTIEYPPGKPQISRIRGMERSPVGPLGLLPVIFPIIGLCFIIHRVRKGFRAVRLLAIGEQATGRLTSKVKTRVKANEEPVYKLTFEFKTREGLTCKAVAKTHLAEKLEDEHEEPLLYDPSEPCNAVMLDNLPGLPRIDENGNICSGPVLVTVVRLFIPGISVVGHVSYICWRLLS